jgi:glycosyltransferase involved in cell wall biosynthesis
MTISPRKRRRIVGTILARDEADIIGPMIEHHLSQGITDILFTDNSSKDRTLEIVSRYPEVREIAVSADMTHNQELHTTRMARLACKFEPDWIVHLDADELWCGRAAWATTAYVHPPVPGDLFRFDRQRHYIDFRGFAREFKVIHRPDPEIVICHGNHFVHGAPCGYTSKVYRHHYPIRSYGQFERKVIQGATALKLRGFVCERWYKWLDLHEAGLLRAHYDMLATSWREMVDKAEADQDVLHELLVRCYGVQPEVAQETFESIATTGLKPLIKRWVPGTGEKPRGVLL